MPNVVVRALAQVISQPLDGWALDRALYQAHFHHTIVEGPHQQSTCNQECPHVDDIQSPLVVCVWQGPHCDPDTDAENNEAKHEENDRPCPSKLWPYARHLSAVRASGESIVECVEEEGVVTVCTGNPAHTRHLWDRDRGRGGGGQVYDPLTVWPGTGNPLGTAFANEEAVTGTPHILSAWRSIPNGSRFITGVTLHHMLILLTRDVYHSTANPTRNHRNPS